MSDLLDDPIFSTLDQILREGLSTLDLAIDDEAVDKMLRYIALLQQWNKTYNLTSITDFPTMVTHHLLDSLSVSKYLEGRRFIDVGSGGGLPGIPLAIQLKNKEFSLLDSNGKKVRFLFQVKAMLQLANVSELHHRVGEFRPEQGFDGVVSRAFSSLKDMLLNTEHLLAPGGLFYAMKGRFPDKELSELPKGYMVQQALSLDVPNLDQERHLIIIKKT